MAVVVHIEGLVPYSVGQSLQSTLLTHRIEHRIPDVVLVLQHEAVITVGRAREAHQHILPNNQLPVVEVRRGGDVTLHAPGQWVAYPIVRLEGQRQDLLDHMRRLETAVIDTLSQFGLTGQRDPRNTGVWMPNPTGSPLKVCSVGIACRKWVTWHGLALNWDIDMSLYASLNPCGFSSDVMTRAQDWLKAPIPAAEVRQTLSQSLLIHLELDSPKTHTFSATQLGQLPEFLANLSIDE